MFSALLLCVIILQISHLCSSTSNTDYPGYSDVSIVFCETVADKLAGVVNDIPELRFFSRGKKQS